MSATVKGIIIGVLGTVLALILIGLTMVLAGGYNVAATDRHNAVVGWALTTTMRNHVQGAAGDLAAPAKISPAMIAAGAGEYKAMCEQCHGGIDVARAAWSETMQPLPPALARAAGRWTLEEVYWLVDNGVKMSGMPAFGPTHDDQTLWNIAAFVKAMPALTPAEYAAFPMGHGGAEHSHDGADAASGASDHVGPPGAAPHEH